MDSPSEGGEREVHSVRLAFRSTAQNMQKLIAIARAKRWTNAQGKPNISAALNLLIESFDLSTVERSKKKGK